MDHKPLLDSVKLLGVVMMDVTIIEQSTRQIARALRFSAILLSEKHDNRWPEGDLRE